MRAAALSKCPSCCVTAVSAPFRGRSAVAVGSVVSVLGQSAEDHLSILRVLGYKLVDEGRLLMDFVAFVDQSGAVAVITSGITATSA